METVDILFKKIYLNFKKFKNTLVRSILLRKVTKKKNLPSIYK